MKALATLIFSLSYLLAIAAWQPWTEDIYWQEDALGVIANDDPYFNYTIYAYMAYTNTNTLGQVVDYSAVGTNVMYYPAGAARPTWTNRMQFSKALDPCWYFDQGDYLYSPARTNYSSQISTGKLWTIVGWGEYLNYEDVRYMTVFGCYSNLSYGLRGGYAVDCIPSVVGPTSWSESYYVLRLDASNRTVFGCSALGTGRFQASTPAMFVVSWRGSTNDFDIYVNGGKAEKVIYTNTLNRDIFITSGMNNYAMVENGLLRFMGGYLGGVRVYTNYAFSDQDASDYFWRNSPKIGFGPSWKDTPDIWSNSIYCLSGNAHNYFSQTARHQSNHIAITITGADAGDGTTNGNYYFGRNIQTTVYPKIWSLTNSVDGGGRATSVEAWLFMPNFANARQVYLVGWSGIWADQYANITAGKRFEWRIYDTNTAGRLYFYSAANFPSQQWVHTVATWDPAIGTNGGFCFYTNGLKTTNTLVSMTGSFVQSRPITRTCYITTGANVGNDGKFKYDYLTIYTNAMASNDVWRRYQATKAEFGL